MKFHYCELLACKANIKGPNRPTHVLKVISLLNQSERVYKGSVHELGLILGPPRIRIFLYYLNQRQK